MKIIILLLFAFSIISAKDVFNSENIRTIIYERLDGNKYIFNSNDKSLTSMNNSQCFFKKNTVDEKSTYVYYRNKNEVYKTNDLKKWTKIYDYNIKEQTQDEFPIELLIYPNPAQNELIIKNMNGWNLKIQDVVGFVCFDGTIDDNDLKIDISNFPSGYYSICFKNKTQYIFKRFVKL